MIINVEYLQNAVKESQKGVIPEGHILVVGSKEVYDKMIEQEWEGKYEYSEIMPDNSAVLMALNISVPHIYYPPYDFSNINKQSDDK